MDIKIRNSLGNQKQVLRPLKGKTINMYSCGVTVYDRCHIGHGRSLYIFDVIRRYLRYRNFDVLLVRNITDIDDKIINKANETKQEWKAIVDENIASYYQDLDNLGVDRADVEPRATENIPEMVKHIEELVRKGFAYVVDGDVYFSVRQFKDYGKLSGQSIEKMQEAVRIEKGEKKKDPLDFALWKKSKEGEPSWESPWGAGRPGWHIECSAMSMKYAGCETLDIHAGGRDLIFPHHENEVAQSEALTGKPFAKYWLHHGLLTINGQKMAKSLKNFITIEEALKKYVNDDLKLFYLSAHYSSPIDYTDEKMKEASQNRRKLQIFSQRISDIRAGHESQPVQKEGFIADREQEFLDAMDDDFNTPKALGALYGLATDVNRFIDERSSEIQKHIGVVCYAGKVFERMVKEIFGLWITDVEKLASILENDLLKKRDEARKQKDFKRSDELRDALKKLGVIVEDGPGGQKWRRS